MPQAYEEEITVTPEGDPNPFGRDAFESFLADLIAGQLRGGEAGGQWLPPIDTFGPPEEIFGPFDWREYGRQASRVTDHSNLLPWSKRKKDYQDGEPFGHWPRANLKGGWLGRLKGRLGDLGDQGKRKAIQAALSGLGSVATAAHASKGSSGGGSGLGPLADLEAKEAQQRLELQEAIRAAIENEAKGGKPPALVLDLDKPQRYDWDKVASPVRYNRLLSLLGASGRPGSSATQQQAVLDAEKRLDDLRRFDALGSSLEWLIQNFLSGDKDDD